MTLEEIEKSIATWREHKSWCRSYYPDHIGDWLVNRVKEFEAELDDYKSGCEGLKLSVDDLRNERDKLEELMRFNRMSSPRLDFYCPACGESSVLVLEFKFKLSPGSIKITCPNCEIEFDVWIEFKELAE